MFLLAGFGVVSADAKKPVRTPIMHHSLSVSSNPSGAHIFINGRPTGIYTPGVVDVELRGEVYHSNNAAKRDAAIASAKKECSITVSLQKDGYESATQVLEPSISYQSLGLFSSYTLYTFDWPKSTHFNLAATHGRAYADDPTIPAGQANLRVSRDHAGRTELERTIIRWYFDSDPQGARIFWRVISSVPAEVKNTNETYLMTTPYEETRSFNIQGLTYENSRDVQIEVKIVKNGYEPQVKRFNVRQAIDQQEISSFFMLVKKDE